MKNTPKSCSCKACKRGKSTKNGKFFLKQSERAYRHFSKVQLMKGREDISSAPYSGYTD